MVGFNSLVRLGLKSVCFPSCLNIFSSGAALPNTLLAAVKSPNPILVFLLAAVKSPNPVLVLLLAAVKSPNPMLVLLIEL